MASLRKKGKVWYVRVRDESGRQREVKAGPDKSVANQMKRDLESKTQRIKAGVLDPREADAMDAERISYRSARRRLYPEPGSQGGLSPASQEHREASWLVPGREQDQPAVSTPPLPGGLRPEGPERRGTGRSDCQALRDGMEKFFEMGMEGSADPNGHAG